MIMLRRSNHWLMILVSFSIMSLLFQNCSNSSDSSSPTSLPQENLFYAESISQLNLRNNTESVDVKDAYLYVGNTYSVGFLNLFVRSGADLIIEIESSSTAICTLNRVTNSRQAFIGSCSQQGLLDLKITFNNPGQPTSIEKRHLFVINKTVNPITQVDPVSTPPVTTVSQAPVEYLNTIGYSISNVTGNTLKVSTLYAIIYDEFVNFGTSYIYTSLKIVKSESSTAKCTVSPLNRGVPYQSAFAVKFTFTCESRGVLRFEIIPQNKNPSAIIEYIVE